MIGLVVAVGRWSHFAGRSLLPTLFVVARPSLWVRPLHAVLIGALPLIGVLGLTLGAVIWMQTRGAVSRRIGEAPSISRASICSPIRIAVNSAP